MRRLAPILFAAWVTGCGDQPPPASAPLPPRAEAPRAEAPRAETMGCERGWTYPDRRYFEGDWREQAVIAGPVKLLFLRGYARSDPGTFRRRDDGRRRALHQKVVLAPRRTVTVRVHGPVSMTQQFVTERFAFAEGEKALRLEGCAPRVDDSRRGEEQGTGYAFALVVDEPGCATFEITPKGGGATMRRRVGFGVSGC